MENFKNKVIKLAISGVAIFAVGLIVGYQLDNGSLSSIQGYLFNAVGEASDPNATSSNATSSNASDANASDSNLSNYNASDSNASSSNASSSNASSSNASSANASATDNIIYLQNFELSSTSVKPGDRVNVTILTSGACNSGVSIVFKGANGATFTAQVQDLTGTPYIIVPTSAVATTYSITDVLLIGTNSDNTTFTKRYGNTGINTYNFNSTLTVTGKDKVESRNPSPSSKLSLTSLSFNSTSVKVSEKVYLNIQTSQKLTSLKLIFISTDGKVLSVYAKDIMGTNPYIEIPSSTIAGTYSLTNAIISNSNGSTSYSKEGGNDTEKFDFNSVLEISEGEKTTYIYNNEDVTSDILTKLYNAPNGSEITINADSNTLIDEELFNTIKGKNKKLIINYKDNQIVFNGNDITSSKTIDVTMTINNVSSNEKIGKLVANGVVVSFPDNGNLPGKALVKVKTTDEIDKILNDNVYVYIFNKSSNNFCVVDTDVKKSSEGYYEFSITHNSEYLITNNKLDDKLVVAQREDNVVSFQKSNKIYLLLIVIGLLVIIVVLVVIIILKKKKGNNSSPSIKKENDDSFKEDSSKEEIDNEDSDNKDDTDEDDANEDNDL